MNKEIINKIVHTINTNILDKKNFEQDAVQFSDSRYKSINFSLKNFRKIQSVSAENKLAFIDGGSTTIIDSPNFCLHFIRVYYTIYQHNKRIKNEKFEFYLLCDAIGKENEIFFRGRVYNLTGQLLVDENDLLFNSMDNSIKKNIHRASINVLADISRRFAELKVCEIVCNHLNNGDVIMIDGSLQQTFQNEEKYLSNLYGVAKQKNISVCGLSKTTNLFTKTGNSVAGLLNSVSEENGFDSWFYYPVVNIENPKHKANIYFVKLNEKSKYVFRFETYSEIDKTNMNVENIFYLLSQNSTDPVFLGYPYGLIEADKFARVADNEKEYFKALFMSSAGKSWKVIQNYLSAKNAHDVLDNIG